MGNTPITSELLRQKGFVEKTIFGKNMYVKNKIAIMYSFSWIPCTLEFGQPLSTNIYVTTWEELEKLMMEGGQDAR